MSDKLIYEIYDEDHEDYDDVKEIFNNKQMYLNKIFHNEETGTNMRIIDILKKEKNYCIVVCNIPSIENDYYTKKAHNLMFKINNKNKTRGEK